MVLSTSSASAILRMKRPVPGARSPIFDALSREAIKGPQGARRHRSDAPAAW
jgi:hypothetical protein